MKLKAKIGFLILGFGLLACEPTDRYGPELACVPVGIMSLNVVLYDRVEQVEQAYENWMRQKGVRIQRDATRDAFCVLRSDNSRTCYLPKLRGQRDNDRMLLWGHEFAHVVCGDWHEPDFEWN